MTFDQEKKQQWRTGMWMVLVVLACTAFCCFGGGITAGWTVWH